MASDMVQPWPLDATLASNAGWDPENLDAGQLQAVQLASETLWLATAHTYGLVTTRTRPVCQQGAGWPPRAAITGGRWRNTASSCGYGCCGAAGVRLPGPVHEVLAVRVDGQLLPAEQWRVAGDRLTRVDGVWPAVQNLALPDTEPGTWSVTYDRGIAPSTAGRAAVTALAVELNRARTGDGKCKLPQRVQTITREGITMTLLDPQEFLDKGRTGLPDVDRWLVLVNPGGQRSPSVVASVDYPACQ